MRIDVPADVRHAIERLAAGDAVAHPFGNFYAISSRPEVFVVRAFNELKGRPASQVGSILTTPSRLDDVFDWTLLPPPLTRSLARAVMHTCLDAGPIGFRGPAASWVPDHLALVADGVRTTQVITPGTACPSATFVAQALARVEARALYVTSANRSRALSGADDEPAHYRADGLAADFAGYGRLVLVEHADEQAARQRYPLHQPMSTTILSLHRTGGTDEAGRLRLVVERHGSLALDDLRRLLDPLGVTAVLGARAAVRLSPRRYAGPGTA